MPEKRSGGWTRLYACLKLATNEADKDGWPQEGIGRGGPTVGTSPCKTKGRQAQYAASIPTQSMGTRT